MGLTYVFLDSAIFIFNLIFQYSIISTFPHILEGIMVRMNYWTMDARKDGWMDGQMGGWMYRDRKKLLLTHNTQRS